MPRIAFKMTVYPESHQEYSRRHQPIWPELESVLRDHGVERYFIFLNREESELFGYAEVESLERWNAIGETEVCRRWWQFMKVLMPSHPDGQPVSVPLQEVFALDLEPKVH